MGHTHHTYDEFDESLVRPLYGYVTDFKSGKVPNWVKKKRLTQESRVADLLGIEYEDYTSELSRSELPAGVTKNTRRTPGDRSRRVEYVFTPKKWLEAHREQSSNDRVSNYVRFDLKDKKNTGTMSCRRRTDPVPNEINERLSAVTETSYWDRKFDGYHVQFFGWELHYEIGNRGGIQSVHLKADANH